MSPSINGFYAAYLTGSAGQGLAMLVFRNGTIVGVDAAGAKYDGAHSDTGRGRNPASIPNVFEVFNAKRFQAQELNLPGRLLRGKIILPQELLSALPAGGLCTTHRVAESC
jgi:hypothetical protein